MVTFQRHLQIYIERNTFLVNFTMFAPIGKSEVRASAFKWNMAHLEVEIADLLRDEWADLPAQTSFFSKLKTISRLYRQVSKSKARDIKRLELET